MSLLRRIDTKPPAADGAPPAPVMEPSAPIPLMTQLPTRDPYKDEKFKLLQRVMNELDADLDLSNEAEVRRSIEATFKRIIDEEGLPLTRGERARLLEQVVDEIIGYGPIEPMLRDDTVTEVMVNGAHSIYVERAGMLEFTNVEFRDDEHVMRIIDRIISPLGRRLDESSPMVDARLPDGSRINAVIPPISLVGPVLTVRKFARRPYTPDDLVRFGTATADMFEFFRACVEARLNIFVSGGTGAGKTTMLNILSQFIGDEERIVTHRRRGRACSYASTTWYRWRRVHRTSRARARCRFASWCAMPCACALIASSSVRCAAARRSTCFRR